MYLIQRKDSQPCCKFCQILDRYGCDCDKEELEALVKDKCITCENKIKKDFGRYLRVGNFCEYCMIRVNRNLI